jgi:glycosyltransferase involved in cell wall biosynthesis
LEEGTRKDKTVKTELEERPLISVVMTVYNNMPFLEVAIQSILNQSYPHFEFIIVNDGSIDGSTSLIQEYADRDGRIRPLFIEHGGISRAANVGISCAKGPFIALMDADDIALRDRLSVQLDWVRQTGIDICGTQVETFGLEEQTYWFPETHEAIRCEMLFRPALLQSSALMRTHILKENPYDENANFQDYELLTRLALRYTMGNIPRVLLRYRRHDGQTHVLRGEAFARDRCKYRFRYFYSLFPGTPLGDYLALARISDKQPMTNVHELRRAGEWLAELADTPDQLLRRRMVKRWQETCERSKGLGGDCEAVLQHYRDLLTITGTNGYSHRSGSHE